MNLVAAELANASVLQAMGCWVVAGKPGMYLKCDPSAA